MNNDKRAKLYVDGVKKANPQANPTWEMLETAFVAGMDEQKRWDDYLMEQICKRP